MHRLDTFPNNDLISKYRQVFSSRAGQAVLVHMFYDLGAFIEISDAPEDVSLRNYGTRLIKILGGGEVDENTMMEFIKRLMKQPLPKEIKEE